MIDTVIIVYTAYKNDKNRSAMLQTKLQYICYKLPSVGHVLNPRRKCKLWAARSAQNFFRCQHKCLYVNPDQQAIHLSTFIDPAET